MKYLILSILLVFATGCSFSQNVKIKNDIAMVDGENYLKYVRQEMANEASVYLLDSENEVIFIRYMSYINPANISKSNPEGKVRWIEINFLTLELKCEVDSRTHQALVKLFYNNGLVTDNALNEEKIRLFVSKYGTTYSDNRPNSTIIITN